MRWLGLPSETRLMGRGDRNGADDAAVKAMRRALAELAICGTVVIGEGERDEAPMLFIGERVGRCGEEDPEIEIAVSAGVRSRSHRARFSRAARLCALPRRNHTGRDTA